MPRNGKIARLPRQLREEVNLKLDNNIQGDEILAWLNALPETKQALEGCFDGVEVTKQNLSDWRQGGYREWSLRREIFQEARELRDSVGGLAQELDPALIAGDLAAVLAAHYAKALAGWDGKFNEELEKDVRLLRMLIRDVALLQRTSHQADRQEAESDQCQEEEEKKEIQVMKEEVLAPIKAKMRERELTFVYNAFQKSSKIASFVAAIEHNLPTKPLAELMEEPDEPSELQQQLQNPPIVPGQGQSRWKTGKRTKKTNRGAKRDKV
jgi:hypothetical protein